MIARLKGILEEKGIAAFPGIYTASLGKALGNAGGMMSLVSPMDMKM